MKEKQNISQSIKKGIAKAILYAFLLVFFILSFIAVAMQSSYVQTKVAQMGSEYLSEKLGFTITIERINIEWFDQLSINQLVVKDLDNEEFIKADRLLVDYDINQLINDESILLDEVILSNARVLLIRDSGENYFNIDNLILAIREMSGTKKRRNRTAKRFIIQEISLQDITLGIANMNADSIKEGFNYNQFILKDLNGQVSNFQSKRDTITMMVHKLSAIDSASGLNLKNISTDFEISQRKMRLSKLDLLFNDSHITDSILFTYNAMNNLSYITDSVNISAHFSNSKITAKDLALFAPYLERYSDLYYVDGTFNGKVKNFSAKDIAISFGSNSFLKGDLRMDGLPKFNESFIDFSVDQARFEAEDIAQYVNDSIVNRKLRITDRLNFTGKFIGFPKDFVANGVFTSPLGRVESDLNLKIAEKVAQSKYRGSISTFNFNLGRILESDSLVQKVQMTGKINGQGLSFTTANLKLTANIGFIGINGYEYQNIKTDAEFAKEFFNGKLNVKDPKLKLDIDGSIDFRESKNIVNVNIKLDTVNLSQLNITEKDAFIKAEGSLKTIGNDLNKLVGEASLKNVYAKFKGNSLQLDTLGVITSLKDDIRELSINSDLITGNLNGNYQFRALINDIQTLTKEFILNIENNEEEIEEYYASLDTTSIRPQYKAYYDLKIKKINPLIKLFVPQLYIKPNTNLRGNFIKGNNSILNISAQVDSLNYEGNSFEAVDIDVNFSKDPFSRTVLGMAYIYSKEQNLFDRLYTQNIETELIWTGQEIDFTLHADQPKYQNNIDLAGILYFKEDSTQINITNSSIAALNNTWTFPEDNLYYITDDGHHFKNFGIIAKDQSIILDGSITQDSSKYLTASINSFNLEGVNTISNSREFKGFADGTIRINRIENKTLVLSDLSIRDFHVDNFLVGDITGISNWKAVERKLGLDFLVKRKGNKIINISGDYIPGNTANSLQLVADLQDANLVIAEPFVNTIFSEIKGLVNGSFNIRGSLDYPIIDGVGNVTEGRVKVNYLNTVYNFNGAVTFDQDKISLNNIQLKDDDDNLAYLGGDLLHNGFTDLFLDLKGNMYDFHVLNTTASDNSLYYGSAFVSGDISFYGPSNNLTIDARAKSEKGTKMYIPVESSSSIEQEDYIHFIKVKDTINNSKAKINKVDQVDITGLALNFDLELTPDAYAEIIFDIKSGDIIRGRGNGKISLNIDTNGAFTMLGDYTLTEGGYNFTLYNIINKEFSIQAGSTITWDGDPYGGNLDITAIYEQNISLLPVVDTAYSDSPELKRRYPAQVILDLQGDLLKPQVDFDIDISGYPEVINSEIGAYSLGPVMASFEAELQADEQEMKRQVFSLIILRRLSPPSSFAVSGSIGNSVSEFLSNQLSYWVTQIDENLEIDVDLGSFSEEQFNTFQLRLSYSFLDGRLRITRDGGFTQGNTSDVNQEIIGILGDWSLEYLLSEDGKLRVKIYNKTNYNALDAVTNAVTTSTGVSLVHVTSFNQIKEVFMKNKQQKPTPRKENEEENEGTNEQKPDNNDKALKEEEEENNSK